MSSAATFVLAVAALSVVVVGTAYLQISWRTSGASLRVERRLASIRRGIRTRPDDFADDFEDFDANPAVDSAPAVVDEAARPANILLGLCKSQVASDYQAPREGIASFEA
jgi:hypothetical protein